MTTTHVARLSSDYLQGKFASALAYDPYVAKGTDTQRSAWQEMHDRADLSAEQHALLAGFTRKMHILVVSGVWCGDCVQQVPFLQRIAQGNPDKIDFRLLDREEHMDLAEQLQINQGLRVPVALFLAEDYELVTIFGDRTLSRYRAMAARHLGASCPIPGAPLAEDELRATLQEWLDEVERAQLILRLSTRLREKHGD